MIAAETNLLPHNISVYERFCAILEEENKVILITATGTGKSYITDQYLADNNMHALVVCPKKSICKQWESLTVRVTAITYHAFSKIEDFSILQDYDCVVFDEAHHCCSPVWGRVIRAFMDQADMPVIGLTADSKRYSDGGKDVAIELWDGCIVIGYDQAEAVKQGILPAATYVCTLFDAGVAADAVKKHPNFQRVSPELAARLDYSAQNCLSIKEILHRYNVVGKRKGIVFADRIDAIPEAEALMKECYPRADTLAVHSEMSASVIDDALEQFQTMDEGYLVVVDMLNEGVHIPGVNTIIMLRRTGSPTIFMQQCGRALSPGNENVIIFDFVGNNRSLRTISVRVAEACAFCADRSPAGHSSQVIVHDFASDFLAVMERIQRELDSAWTAEEDAIMREYFPLEGRLVCDRLPGRTKFACQHRAKDLGLSYARQNRWTEDENAIIRAYFPSEGPSVSGRLPGRTPSACQNQARKLGVGAERFWTEEEDAILRKFYPTEGSAVADRIPGRTRSSCLYRAVTLGIRTRFPWTEEEDAVLKEFYPSEGKRVAKRLPGRTANTCQRRARALGLGMTYSRATVWNEEEIRILREFYAAEGSAIVDRLPGKTSSACYKKAKELGLCKSRAVQWTEEEDAIIREFYLSEGCGVASRLPGRTEQACKGRAMVLGVTSRKSVQWTEAEDAIIREFYPAEGITVVKRLPGRTEAACMLRARKFNIRTLKFWTEEEDAILREYFPLEGSAVANRLPGRGKPNCQQRAETLGIRCEKKRPPWTEEEDAILRQYYPIEGKLVSFRLPGRTKEACANHAYKLGLLVQERTR